MTLDSEHFVGYCPYNEDSAIGRCPFSNNESGYRISEPKGEACEKCLRYASSKEELTKLIETE